MEKRTIRVLLAEDDENLGFLLKEYLQAKEYDVDLYKDGEKAYRGFQNNYYDICILDVMMPIKDGFTLAKEIRMANPAMPILFLTAKSLKEDVIEGFSIGADDYMTKPFSIEELLMRIEAILRRTRKDSPDSEQSSFQIGRYLFDATKQTLQLDDEVRKLTTKESELLKYLCINKNSLLDRNFALKTIWVDDSYFNARSMDVYITKLRKYLADDPTIEIINVRGKGFKLIF
ncbi:MAG: response regulator transcription factor [Bacteroidales bacterium]|jgi:DNA-binding response OmpR family regulator|nr:response regulator transcription factor [Bacteroidales bacterium]HNT40697.1 response regulator transcription factor [Tenuifilaceae bacterium]MBP8644186.1 response regulator transcription factor [Bacteroidales bacterium]NLI87748.1 response regulator transcription factor [Bacteroidales bacterium]HOA10515.1 response regulator transcription factor [Tenuifilaceae bacterium]